MNVKELQMDNDPKNVKMSDLISDELKGEAAPTIPVDSGTNAALKVEETDVVEEKIPTEAVVSGNFTNVFDYLTMYKDKLLNATLESITFKNVPEDKYMFFVGSCESEAEIVQIANPKQLAILHSSEPKAIVIFPSGILVENDTHRTYIMKTNCVQFAINKDSFPTTRFAISKVPMSGGDPKVEEFTPEGETVTFSDTERLKTELNKEAKSLYETTKDFQSLDEMKKEVLTFMRTKKDILYLIKLENIMIRTA